MAKPSWAPSVRDALGTVDSPTDGMATLGMEWPLVDSPAEAPDAGPEPDEAAGRHVTEIPPLVRPSVTTAPMPRRRPFEDRDDEATAEPPAQSDPLDWMTSVAAVPAEPAAQPDRGYDQLAAWAPDPEPLPEAQPANGDSDLLIFAAVRSAWFSDEEDRPPLDWNTPSDSGWKAARNASEPAVGGFTTNGLPRRVPRANLIPGSALPPPRRDVPPPVIQRDPDRLAANTVAYFGGWQRARGDDQDADPTAVR